MTPEEVVFYDVAEFREFLGLDADAKTAEVVRKPPPKTADQAGGRNNYFTSIAGSMRRRGLGPDPILAAIRAENESKGYGLPDRELVTIAGSIGSYEIDDTPGDNSALDGNIIQGLQNHGLRIDAAGRFRDIGTGSISWKITAPLLTSLIWSDLRKIKKVSAEDIARLLEVETYRAQRREFDRIAGRVLGRPETPEAIEELRRFVKAVSGSVDTAVVGGFLQFLWCVKRSLAGSEREHDIMPILYNQIQGNGKSTAVRRLVMPLEELVDSITVETLADERKRADLGRFAVGVWDEMEGADKRDTDAIKNAISSQTVSYRPMRTNDNVTLVRLMNFIGTSNKPLAAMVRDSSGNRRFMEVETPPRLDQEAINEINYDLLWQAVSEKSRAPAKEILGEIKTHQAAGRFQDTVSLWLEDEDFSAYQGAGIPCDEMRARYTEWCDRSKDNPIPTSMFNHRMTAEGYRKARLRTGSGRPWGFLFPGGPNGVTVEPNPGEMVQSDSINGPRKVPLFTDVISNIEIGPKNIMVQTPEPFPGTSKPLVQWSNGPGTPWPKPPGRDNPVLWVYDCEVFPNRFMCSAWNGSEWAEFDQDNLSDFRRFVKDKRKVLAGFNNHSYDDVLIGAIAADTRISKASDIYKLSCRLIDPETEAEKEANFKDRYKGRPWAYSIDVFQILNGKGALKEWECRIGFPTVSESPAPFDRALYDTLVPSVREYCRNDVRATAQILLDKWQLVELRALLADQFDLGNRAYCLSEQGLAQSTFLTQHRSRTGENSNAVRAKAAEAPENTPSAFPMASLISDRIKFRTQPFRGTLERLSAGQLVKSEKGGWSIVLDTGAAIDAAFTLAGCEVSLGVGGLHTVDKPGRLEATEETGIIDLDVTSYYPSLMINEGVYPSQMGPEFLTDLKDIRARRLEAKKAGDKITSEALKIVLNATFGKLNDQWSPIRSVSNAFRVTINGQLYLLMLMEALASAGFEILSANTDGVTIRGKRSHLAAELPGVIDPWQQATGLTLEQTAFARIARRDVNTYVAVTEDGKVKSKGDLNPESGKMDGRVIRNAAIAYLLHGIDPSETVANEKDAVAFLFYQRAKNGGDLHAGEQMLGKTARWYVTTDGVALRRKNPDGTFDTIPNGHHIGLALDITGKTAETLAGLDRSYYVRAAQELAAETAVC